MAAAAWLRSSLFAVLRLRPPPRPLFPYTTLFRSRRRLGQLRAVETALAVHVRRRPQRAPQWSGRAGGDGNVGAARQLEHLERVAGRLVERRVAGDGRDRAQLDLGRGEREQDRDRVV